MFPTQLKNYVIQREYRLGMVLLMTQDSGAVMLTVLFADEHTAMDHLLHEVEWPELQTYAMLDRDEEILRQPHGLNWLASTVLKRSVAVADRLAGTLSR